MSRLRVFLLALLCIAPICFSACSKEAAKSEEKPAADKVYIIGVNPDYPPMASVDEKTGEIIGYEIDLMNKIAEKGGFKIQWKSVAWKGIFGALESHDIDAIMSSASVTPERQKAYDFSNSYYVISQTLVVRKEDAASVKDVKDLDGKEIAVQLNTTGEQLVAKQFPKWRTKSYDGPPLAFADLKNKAVFGFMVDEPVARSFALADPKTADLFTPLPFKFSEENYGIVVRKGDKELLDKINAGLKAVKEAGIDSDLQKNWIK